MRPLVVDASVWVAAADPSDAYCDASRRFLEVLALRAQPVALPELARVEVACALARRLRHTDAAAKLACGVRQSPLVVLWPLDRALADAAVALGTQERLRGADAVYAALAREVGGELVSWDREHLTRARAVTPKAWLEREGV